MQVQFNSDSSVMGTENVAERIEAAVREKLSRFEERLTRIEVHVRDENAHKGGNDDKACTIEARPRSGRAIGVTEHAATVDLAARKAANTLAQRLERHFGKAERHKHDPSPDKII
ncbi:HPF/RaiA family ribosome-associated protein [Alteraurantiacibacter aquimixticola]|uniref:HPF/RaiA family ribosome-associated protein n=1 Tax=Alteraurantiacibacter aquimixticola TaxID=2489173 RepID=A0A4T3EYK7_9SPHN|nr:HPF/RaiA family ribosome-associated protein [Alteraurantiacibacter aquimixticola]TIX49749.1 HPF/RaiA family ribosome-associated protein [Alteraurantiacibacter aquimixticola]